MGAAEQRYDEFVRRVKELRTLGSIEWLLNWDQQTMMPKSGADNRAGQLATLAAVIHEKRTDPRFVELIQSLQSESSLSADARVNLRETWREVERAIKVPAELVRAIVTAEADTHQLWLDARKANKFAVVSSALEKLVGLKREYAQATFRRGSLYDALLDLYEPDESAANLKQLFAPVRTALTTLLQRIVDKAGPSGIPNPARGPFPTQLQKQFCEEAVRGIGFDMDCGRLDETVHPFCNGVGIRDVRLTTRFEDDDIASALMAALHEAGHGIYDQGLDPANENTPLSEALSLAIHESQSLLWEKRVGRSFEYWSHLYPKLQSTFPGALKDVKLDDYYRFINQVRPSLNRVESDEVTYGLHVIIRFELEQSLIEGAISVKELPALWNEAYQKALGITPPDDLSGILQDTHWYSGALGYFPTYLLGAMYATQLFEAYEKINPEIRLQIKRGEMGELKRWLNKSIHREGRRYTAKDLMERATGSQPSSESYLRYLNKKYGELYNLK